MGTQGLHAAVLGSLNSVQCVMCSRIQARVGHSPGNCLAKPCTISLTQLPILKEKYNVKTAHDLQLRRALCHPLLKEFLCILFSATSPCKECSTK